MVMLNGRLYDGKTLAETAGSKRPAPKFWWQRGRVALGARGSGLGARGSGLGGAEVVVSGFSRTQRLA